MSIIPNFASNLIPEKHPQSVGDFLFKQKEKGISLKISAPGKVILHGEHSVVHGKLAIAASLGLRTHLELYEIIPSDQVSKIISVSAPDIDLFQHFDLEILNSLLNHPIPVSSGKLFNWLTPDELDDKLAIEVVETWLSKNITSELPTSHKHSIVSLLYLLWGIFGSLNIPIKSFAIIIKTDLTVGAGTGSSASFSVCLAAALIQYLKCLLNNKESDGVSKEIYNFFRPDLSSFSNDELDLISKWAFHAEKVIHGTPSGIDNTICTYGSLVAFRKTQEPRIIKLNNPFGLLLINTNISRNTKKLVALCASLKNKYPSIVDKVLEAMDEISVNALSCIEKYNNLSTENNPDKAILEFKQLEELFIMNHDLLRFLGVSHKSLEDICLTLKEHGLKGKLTGAGGGGYAICLLLPNSNKKLVDVMECLSVKGYSPLMTNLGGPGVQIDYAHL